MRERQADRAAVNAVAQAEQALPQAHLDLDLDEIDRRLHPDYVIVQPGGRVETKQEVLASYRSGTRRWDVARSDELEIRIYGETAIVLGLWIARGVNGQDAFDYRARFLAVWIKRDGQWRNVTSQSTEIGAA